MNQALNIPRTIWMMWSSGIDSAPAVVRACVDSWRRHHPAWRVEVLDRARAGDFLDINSITGATLDAVNPVTLADIIRVNILASRGGVWADATSYCTQPLEHWLPSHLTSGFFAFRNPGPDRLLSSWFLASQPENHLMGTWHEQAITYWRQHHFPTPAIYPRLHAWLTRLLGTNVRRAQWWFSSPVTRGLKLYPYFWLHYLFSRVVERDARCRQIWNDTPRLDARASHALQFEGRGLVRPMSAETKALWESGVTPVFKLSYKVNGEEIEADSPLDHVLNRHSSEWTGTPGHPR